MSAPLSLMKLSLTNLNSLSETEFVRLFGAVLEHSPRYAQAVAAGRPYASAEAVAGAFMQAALQGGPDAQMALIRANPDLAGKAAMSGEITAESASEQASAGLDRLNPDEYGEFHRLNVAYHARFDMPYIVCVREQTKASILRGAAERLEHTPGQERQTALYEIGRIARLRVLDLIGQDSAGQESAEEKEGGGQMTDTADRASVKVVLGQNTYGKADVRLFKVFREQARHEVRDVWVNVAMEGDFQAAHVLGDNSGLLATDTVRNTVYALAGDGLTSSVEEFGKVLVRHFVAAGPKVKSVRVQLTQHLWQRLTTSAGQEHDHAFSRLMPKHTAWVEGDGHTFTVTSGIDELFILKTTQSGWAGFLREEFTTLPDTKDRILATVVTAKWEYQLGEVDAEIDYDAVWQRVYDQLLATFGDHYSPSMQNTLYRMGEAILTVCPEISRIHFSFPNRHHIPYNLERFGLENNNTIFHANAEPYGLIEGWVERLSVERVSGDSA